MDDEDGADISALIRTAEAMHKLLSMLQVIGSPGLDMQKVPDVALGGNAEVATVVKEVAESAELASRSVAIERLGAAEQILKLSI